MYNHAEPLLTRGDLLRLRLLSESVESITGDGDFGGLTITFSNGDVVSILHFNHKDELGCEVRP